ncbi:hypothetical protein T484DRAFT_1862466 [Baffinella frigidus]|nr:hypothetical protein T484DRAFT_1862466 [Cryptophyta sp. CCMP2293]
MVYQISASASRPKNNSAKKQAPAKKKPPTLSSSSSSDAASATDDEDHDDRDERLEGIHENMVQVLRYRRHKYQGDVNHAIYRLWRAAQGFPPDDLYEQLPDKFMLEIYQNDRSLAMSEMTVQQRHAVARYLGEAWVTVSRQRPETHPANVLARAIEAHHEAQRVEFALMLAMGQHERLGAESWLQNLDPGLVRLIAVFADLAVAPAEEEPK